MAKDCAGNSWATAATGASPWHGESLAGQSILVTAEQGQGDNFHFIRYVPELTARGACFDFSIAPLRFCSIL